MKNLNILSCTVRPKAGCQSIRKADDRYHSFTTPGTDRRETGIINGWVPPPVCLPSVYLDLPDVITRDQISQGFPRRISYWKR